jgi:hypothetical protein
MSLVILLDHIGFVLSMSQNMEGSRLSIPQMDGFVFTEVLQIRSPQSLFLLSYYALMIVKFGEYNLRKIKGK